MITQIIFSSLVVIAFGAFAWSVQRYVRCMLLGKPEDRFDQLGGRVWDFVKYFLFQRKVAELPSEGYPQVKNSLHHLPIFWGFLIITLETVEMIISGISATPHPYQLVVGPTVYGGFMLVVDVTNAAVLLVVLYALFRRAVLRPRLIPLNLDAGVILGLIGALTLTYHAMEASKIRQMSAASQTRGEPAQAQQTAEGSKPEPSLATIKRLLPVSARLSGAFDGMSASTAGKVSAVNWWMHMLIILVFLNYLPYSKHIHLLGAWANIFFRKRKQKGVMPRVDLETALEEPEGEDDEEPDWGVERFDQFTWKELLDTYACTECARCTNHCPADATGKPLSPMEVIHQIRHEMLDRGSKMLRAAKAFGEKKKAIETDLEEMAPMVGKNALDDPSNGRMDDDTIWACTTCGACREVCPVFIEHPNAILRIRTNMVLAQEGRVPKQLADAFEGMERNMNPWGLGIDSRFDWAKGLDIPVLGELDDPEKVEWCFFIGCAGNYDNRMQKQAKAFSRVLDEAGVSYAVLGPEEVCCGDAARRAGHEYLFQMMAEQNIEKLEEYGVQKVVTACPHGYHTLKKEYPQMGGDLEVYHSSQLVSALIDEGKINLTGSLGSKIAVHDSCYLGRWNDIYEEPREIARAAAGKGGFVELPRARSRSFCCGGGGGRFWMEEETPRVNEDRAKEIISAGVDVVATACPFCTTMITDGLKAFDKEEEVEVIDIVEIADKLIKKEGDVEE